MNFCSKSRLNKISKYFLIFILFAVLSLAVGCSGGSGGGGGKDTTPPGGGGGGGGGGGTQTGTVSGTVTDSATTLALSGVTVAIGSYTDITDALGAYTLASVPIGTRTLTGSLTSYNNYSNASVTITASTTTTLDFAMTPTPPPDTTDPSIPGGVTATAHATAYNQIDLVWTTSTDNVAVTGYNIYRDSIFLIAVNASTLSYSDTTLNGSTLYCYSVSAEDAASNESAQSVQSCDTTVAPPLDTSYISLEHFGDDGALPGYCAEFAPAQVTFFIHAKNSFGAYLTSAVLADTAFQSHEDNELMSGTEAIFTMTTRAALASYTIRTPLLIDISNSTASYLANVKLAARTMVNNLLANQEVAVYTFDDTITSVQGYTSNAATLDAAIAGIAAGKPSTDLWGVLSTGVGSFADVYNPITSNAVYCYVLAITDGVDTAAATTVDAWKLARGNKRVYAVGVGDDLSATYMMNDVVYPTSANYIPTATSSQAEIEAAIDKIQTEMEAYTAAIFNVDYYSPSRKPAPAYVSLEISMKSNTNSDVDSSFKDKFDADPFVSPIPLWPISFVDDGF